jgi:hypothetical protein
MLLYRICLWYVGPKARWTRIIKNFQWNLISKEIWNIFILFISALWLSICERNESHAIIEVRSVESTQEVSFRNFHIFFLLLLFIVLCDSQQCLSFFYIAEDEEAKKKNLLTHMCVLNSSAINSLNLIIIIIASSTSWMLNTTTTDCYWSYT